MYFIPLAIFLGAPKPLTVGYYIWKSMIPSLLGNIVGGGLFTGVVYWYLFLAGEEVEIHFDTMPLDTAVYEQGGPLEHQITATGAGTGYSSGEQKVNGVDAAIPNSGNRGVSGLAKDFHARHFKKNQEQSSA